MYLVDKASRRATWSIQPSFPTVKHPRREADHSSHLPPRLWMEWAVTPFPPTSLHGVHKDNNSLHFTSFYLTFMSYRIPFNIYPIKRYSWKYEVEKRNNKTRQRTRTHLRHKLDFQQQTQIINTFEGQAKTMIRWDQVACTTRVTNCGQKPPCATNFSLRFLYLKKDLLCSFGFVAGLRVRYWCWDHYWYRCEGIAETKLLLEEKNDNQACQNTNEQIKKQRMNEIKKQRRKMKKQRRNRRWKEKV